MREGAYALLPRHGAGHFEPKPSFQVLDLPRDRIEVRSDNEQVRGRNTRRTRRLLQCEVLLLPLIRALPVAPGDPPPSGSNKPRDEEE